MGKRPLVATLDAAGGSDTNESTRVPLMRTQLQPSYSSQVVDGGGPGAGLDNAKKALEGLILFSGLPLQDHMSMAHSLSHAYLLLAEQARKAKKRLKGQGLGPQY